MGSNWLLSVPKEEPVIFSGDLNAGALSKTYRTLTKHLIDVQKATDSPKLPKPTYHARSPVFRIDHILISEHFKALSVEVKNNKNISNASDHLPLVVDLMLDVKATKSTCSATKK
jgi:endonuclease/exonuclease/phosphatase family metal-dependent hydrolase